MEGTQAYEIRSPDVMPSSSSSRSAPWRALLSGRDTEHDVRERTPPTDPDVEETAHRRTEIPPRMSAQSAQGIWQPVASEQASSALPVRGAGSLSRQGPPTLLQSRLHHRSLCEVHTGSHRSNHTAITNWDSPIVEASRSDLSDETISLMDRDLLTPAMLREFLDDLTRMERGEDNLHEAFLSDSKVEALHRLAVALEPAPLSDVLPFLNQQTGARIRRLTYLWNIQNFSCIRDHAALSALPFLQNFIESEEFGDEDAGKFYLMLFPYGESGKDLSGVVVKVVSNNKHSTTARASFSVLNSKGQEVSWTKRAFDGFKWFQTSLYYNSLVLFSDADAEELTNICSGDDSLRLKCELEVCVKIFDAPRSSIVSQHEALAHSAPLELKALMLEAWEQNSSAPKSLLDIQILCVANDHEKITFRANSFALAARSKIFRTMLTSSFQEGLKETVLVKDVHPKVLEEALEFIHTDSCASFKNISASAKHVCDLLKFADRFDVESLKLHCVQYLLNCINSRTALDIYTFAKENGQKRLADACLQFVQNTNSGKSLVKNAILDTMPWINVAVDPSKR